MARSRSYTRKMRAKHIKRKKRITLMYPCFREFPYYNFDGKFSKNKIHCSCCMKEADILLQNLKLALR